ncbi:MAG: hypothetical protein NC910_03650 [Candidatus Omnitrophica bacterium]|nr:hypothetical protein [Candidatus Omnitrophota bacterium]
MALTVLPAQPAASAEEASREPVSFRVVAVNPSATKAQQVPVKIYLPQEVTPKDVIDSGELDLEYDDVKSTYYVYKDAVQLAPQETKIFEVLVKDVWMVPQAELDALRNHARLVLKRLEPSEFYQSGKALFDALDERLAGIEQTQNDETLSRKQRIGAYRLSLEAIEKVKEDVAKMEKLLTFTGGVPVPEMLEESKIKSDAPSTKTTWMLIIMILIFLGCLGGLFFWTWHRKAQEEKSIGVLKQGVFGSEEQPNPENRGKAA